MRASLPRFGVVAGSIFVGVVAGCSGSDPGQPPLSPTYRSSGAVAGATQAGVTVTLSGAGGATTTTAVDGS